MRTHLFAVLALCSCVGADDPGEQAQASSAVATTEVPAGSQGTNDSRFFPIGVYQEAPRLIYPDHFTFMGDPATFWRESFSQLKRWGFNTIIPANTGDDWMAVLMQQAIEVGGLNVAFGGAGVDCNLPYTEQGQAIPFAQNLLARYGGNPAMVFYYPQDEPPACSLANVRLFDKQISLLDEAHGAISAVHTDWANPPAPWPPYAPYETVDKMMGIDTFTHDPYWAGGDARDPILRLDQNMDPIFAKIPADKPFYYVVQAFAGDGFKMPSAITLRYETYGALAHGARGIIFFLQASHEDGGSGTGFDDQDFVPSAVCFGPSCPPPGSIFPANYVAVGHEIKNLARELNALAPWLAEAHREEIVNHCGQASGIIFAGAPETADTCDLTTFTTATGQKLFMIVNKHNYAHTFSVTWDRSWADTMWLRNVRGGSTYFGVANTPTTYTGTFALAAGDGLLLQPMRAGDAQIRVARGAVANPIELGTPMTLSATVKNVSNATFSTLARLGVRLYPPGGGGSFTTSAATWTSLAGLAPGATQTVLVSIPTGGPFTQIVQRGTWRVGLDVNDGGRWAGVEQTVAIMIERNPLLVDTFDQPSFKRPADALRKWIRSPLSSIREGALALNGQGLMLSRDGATWTDYVMDFDLMIDAESDTPTAGWAVRASNGKGENGYVLALSVNPSQLTRYRMDNGVLTPLGTVPITQPLAKGSWVHVRTEAIGSTIRTYLGAPSVEVDAFSDGSYRRGGVGFYASEGDPGVFNLWREHVDNVDVRATGTALPPPPAAPVLLSVTPSGTGLKLVWARSPGPNIAAYRVYRGTSPTGLFVPVGAIDAPSYQDDTASGASFYYVAAIAHDNTSSPRSNILAATPQQAPGAPLSLGVSPANMRANFLSWTSPGKAVDHYDVYRADGVAPAAWTEDLRVGRTATTSLWDDPYSTFAGDLAIGARPFQTYVYAVRAVTASGAAGPPAVAGVTMPGSSIASDGFDTAQPGWISTATWSQGNSSATSTDMTQCGATKLVNLPFNDAVVETTVQITGWMDSEQWAGIAIHRQTTRDAYMTSGYLLAYHANGKLVLSRAPNTILAQLWTPLSPTATARKLRVETHGNQIAGYIDGVKYIDVTDATPAPNGDLGFFGLETCGTSARFDDFNAYYREGFHSDAGIGYLAGSGAIDQGSLVLSGAAGLKWNLAGDFTADFDVQIVSEWDNGNGWGGLAFRKQGPLDRYWDSGYLVYLRRNGQINLWRGGLDLASAATGFDPMGQVVHLRVQAVGPLIQVWANGVLEISTSDTGYPGPGYLDLSTDSSQTRFNALQVY